MRDLSRITDRRNRQGYRRRRSLGHSVETFRAWLHARRLSSLGLRSPLLSPAGLSAADEALEAWIMQTTPSVSAMRAIRSRMATRNPAELNLPGCDMGSSGLAELTRTRSDLSGVGKLHHPVGTSPFLNSMSELSRRSVDLWKARQPPIGGPSLCHEPVKAATS